MANVLPGMMTAEAEQRIAQEICQDVKKTAAAKKTPLVLMPPVAEHRICKVLQTGADKYGPWNWRLSKLEMGTYVSAIKRHLAAIHSGEWLDPESGEPHIAHIAATCCVLMDADNEARLDRQVAKPHTIGIS